MTLLGYLFALLATAAGSSKGAISKKLSIGISGTDGNIMLNLARMAICTLIGLFAALAAGGTAALQIPLSGILISLLSAASFTVFALSWMACARSGALIMIDIFLTAGVIIPLIASQVLWETPVTLRQWAGFIILLVGVSILCSYNKKIKNGMSPKLIAVLILCGAANGINSLSQKLFAAECPEYGSFAFNFYTYLFSALFLLGICALRKISFKRLAELKPHIIGLILISVFLYLNLFFKMLAAGILPAARIYPLIQGLGIINSAVIGAVFFKEPITRRSLCGLVVSAAALFLINC